MYLALLEVPHHKTYVQMTLAVVAKIGQAFAYLLRESDSSPWQPLTFRSHFSIDKMILTWAKWCIAWLNSLMIRTKMSFHGDRVFFVRIPTIWRIFSLQKILQFENVSVSTKEGTYKSILRSWTLYFLSSSNRKYQNCSTFSALL